MCFEICENDIALNLLREIAHTNPMNLWKRSEFLPSIKRVGKMVTSEPVWWPISEDKQINQEFYGGTIKPILS